jgi:hypothetical protein
VQSESDRMAIHTIGARAVCVPGQMVVRCLALAQGWTQKESPPETLQAREDPVWPCEVECDMWGDASSTRSHTRSHRGWKSERGSDPFRVYGATVRK